MVFLDVGLGAVEVWIECNGQRRAEYGLKDSVSEGHKHQECHVASEEDKVCLLYLPQPLRRFCSIAGLAA